tara:strand:+ start:7164 stop:8660 length:1497 start_codon:yes stop_codon:yes gene_type:complete
MITTKEPTPDYDVIICGLGPVGATLANLLGLSGISTLVIEREKSAYQLPRAVHLDDEIMRIFQTIGIADEFVQETFVNLGMKFIGSDGKMLMDWPRPQEVGRHGWHASYRFHQPDLERILRKKLSQYGHVHVWDECEVTDAIETNEYVKVRCKHVATSKTSSVTAKYIVGCDGANSLIKSLIDPAMEDLGFEERWLVVDVILNQPKPELGDHTIQYCNPQRPATYCRSPGMRRRWEIAVLEGEKSEDITKSKAVWGLLQNWITPDEAVLERQAVYTFRSAIAQKWRKGRLLIAGDAAHLTPPFMGQGMCAGIRDTYNLAWKLAMICNGLAEDHILDSYQSERHSHVKKYIETAVRLGGLINSLGTEDALKSAFTQPNGSVKMESICPPLGNGLGQDSDPLRGVMFPQPCLTNGQLLDHKIGYHSCILSKNNATPSNLPADVQYLSCENEPAIEQSLDDLNIYAAFIRPDRYILQTAKSHEELHLLIAAAQQKINWQEK